MGFGENIMPWSPAFSSLEITEFQISRPCLQATWISRPSNMKQPQGAHLVLGREP